MKKKSEEVITKTVWQYSEPLPQETLEFLQGIAEDYGKVKNYVYVLKINSVWRLHPGKAGL